MAEGRKLGMPVDWYADLAAEELRNEDRRDEQEARLAAFRKMRKAMRAAGASMGEAATVLAKAFDKNVGKL